MNRNRNSGGTEAGRSAHPIPSHATPDLKSDTHFSGLFNDTSSPSECECECGGMINLVVQGNPHTQPNLDCYCTRVHLYILSVCPKAVVRQVRAGAVIGPDRKCIRAGGSEESYALPITGCLFQQPRSWLGMPMLG